MLGAMSLIWLFFYWQTNGIFLNPRNLSNLMLQTSVTGIIAVGMLLVIISGNIDLSVGSLLALAGGVSAIMLTNMGYGLVPSILGAIAVSVAIGLLQGALTAYFNIPAFIVTLGGLLAWRGAIKGRGVGMIYISHKLDEVFAMSDRITVLRDGQTVGTQNTEDLTKDKIISLMVGRDVGDIFPNLSTNSAKLLWK